MKGLALTRHQPVTTLGFHVWGGWWAKTEVRNVKPDQLLSRATPQVLGEFVHTLGADSHMRDTTDLMPAAHTPAPL